VQRGGRHCARAHALHLHGAARPSACVRIRGAPRSRHPYVYRPSSLCWQAARALDGRSRRRAQGPHHACSVTAGHRTHLASTLGTWSLCGGCAVPWRAHQACRRRASGPAACQGTESSRPSLAARAQPSAEGAARLGGGLGGAGVAQDGLLQRLFRGRAAVPVPVAALARAARARLVLRALLAPHPPTRSVHQCSRAWSGSSESSIPMPPRESCQEASGSAAKRWVLPIPCCRSKPPHPRPAPSPASACFHAHAGRMCPMQSKRAQHRDGCSSGHQPVQSHAGCQA